MLELFETRLGLCRPGFIKNKDIVKYKTDTICQSISDGAKMGKGHDSTVFKLFFYEGILTPPLNSLDRC